MQQEKMTIRGIEYEVHVIDGETILKRYDAKAKMWITLEFAHEEDREEKIEGIKDSVVRGLLGR